MGSGIDIFKWTDTYHRFVLLHLQCKWWQFFRKKLIKEQLDWIYPLMVNERNTFMELSDNR